MIGGSLFVTYWLQKKAFKNGLKEFNEHNALNIRSAEGHKHSKAQVKISNVEKEKSPYDQEEKVIKKNDIINTKALKEKNLNI